MTSPTTSGKSSERDDDSRADILEKWHVTPSGNRDYHFLDGLRGVAILLVLGCHFIYVNPHSGAGTRFVGSLFSAGVLGVPLFFALSGFLISGSFWKRHNSITQSAVPSGYGWRRFYKIFPPVFFSFCLLVPFYIYTTGDSSYVRLALEWLIGVPLFFPIQGKVNPVMWSLIVELHFYIVLPLVMLFFKRLPRSIGLWLLPLLFFLAGFGDRFGFLRATPQLPFPEFLDIGFAGSLDYFALGVLVAGLHCDRKIQPYHAQWAWVGVPLFAGTYVLCGWVHFINSQSLWLGELVAVSVQIACGMLLLCIGNPKGSLPNLLSNPMLRWLGIISFELYLFHQPFLIYSRRLFSAEGNIWRYSLILGAPFVFSLVLAACVYRFFSLPILRYGRARHQG